MQMYQGLPIITNKIPLEERKDIPHHLLGCVGLNEEPWTVGTFVQRALATIEDVHHRQRLPILVGGTHYYLQSLLFRDALAQSSHTCADVSQGGETHEGLWPILEAPTEDLYAKLCEVDPTMAARWHPRDRRKIRRSLEIWLQTGKKTSDVYEEQERERKRMQSIERRDVGSMTNGSLRFPTLLLWTHTPRDSLNSRLNERVRRMVERGLLHEAKELDELRRMYERVGTPVDLTRGIWASIGYKEFRNYLGALAYTETNGNEVARLLEEAIEQTQTATRQYAKNQLRWIRIKLVNALSNASAAGMFVLDTNEPSQWTNTVLAPASNYVDSFLRGDTLPNPWEEGPSASELLTSAQDYDLGRRRDLWQSQTCDICRVTAVTEKAWQQHVGGRNHRGALKAQKKRENGSWGCATDFDENGSVSEVAANDSDRSTKMHDRSLIQSKGLVEAA